MQKITALVNTKLKKQPLDSSQLDPEEYVAVSQDKYYLVTQTEPVGNHTKVTLSHNAGTWFIFNSHWQGLTHPQLIEVDQNNIIAAIQKSANLFGLTLKTQHAYIIATAHWETNQTFKPVKESYWLDENWRRNNLRYFPFYGRGYVQLTWKFNYEKYSKILGFDFVNNPDLVMQPEISLFILCHGFKHGVFTGRRLEDYLTSSKTDFLNARRCINGTDKQHEIASLAYRYLAQM